MPTNPMSQIIHHLRRTLLLREGMDLTDGQLLESFVRRREQAGLEALVRRHGPMVWGVCRRILGNHHDAEDAFQATFLVLVRKAASIVPREMVGNWLYGVAQKTALKARAVTAKRRTKERQEAEMPEPAATEKDLWMDLQPLLDHELGLLPDKYRVVIVLCDLEGKTRHEAACQLGCPEGTVGSRLARARTMLIKRLAARGLAVSGSTLAAVLSEQVASASVPTSVMTTTINAVSMVAAGNAVTGGVISAKVAALTEGVLKAMFLTKLKSMTAAVVLALGIFTFVGGFYMHLAAQPVPAQNAHAQTANIGDGQTAQPLSNGLQGVWIFTDCVDCGRKVPDQECSVMRLELHKEKLVLITPRAPKGKSISGSYTVDPGKKPARMDITLMLEDGKKTYPAIIALEADTLRLCHAATAGGDRPSDMEATSKTVLATLQRHKSDAVQEAVSDPTKKDLRQLQGKWECVSVIHMGKAVEGNLTRFIIEGDKIIYTETRTERFKIDSTKTPKHFDLTVLANEKEEKLVHGIFEIKGDELRICLPTDLQARPKTFESENGSDSRQLILKRVKS